MEEPKQDDLPQLCERLHIQPPNELPQSSMAHNGTQTLHSQGNEMEASGSLGATQDVPAVEEQSPCLASSMETKTPQELPPHPISPAPSPKEVPPVLDEQPPAQTSPEPEDPEDTPQETTAICVETDEEVVENDGEEIFQEQDKFVLCMEDVQALKDSEACITTVKWSKGKKPASKQKDGIKVSTCEGVSQPSTSSTAAAQEQTISTEPPKRGRGRPRKRKKPQKPLRKSSPKSRRGRPKGSRNKSTLAQKVSYNEQARKQEGNKTGEKLANGQVSGQPQQENGVMVRTQDEGAGQPLTSVAANQEQVASTEPLKRGRGRPRKQPHEPTGQPSFKRPRGRPKGSKNKSLSQKEPTGQPSLKRPRGRPKGSKNKSLYQISQKEQTGEPFPKRSRGRPKGSRNKNSFKAVQKVPYSKRENHQASRHKRGKRLASRGVSEQIQLANRIIMIAQGDGQPLIFSAAAAQEQPASIEPPKRGRGRPRKHPRVPMEEPSAKRPRGRPKGSRNKSTSQTAQKVPVEVLSPKRPRGRPKGSRNKSTSQTAQKVSMEETFPKRPRGRPKGSTNKSPSQAAQKVPMEEPSLKRPRGRPKGNTSKSPSQAAQKIPYSRRASRQGRRKRGRKRARGKEREQSQHANGVLMSTQGEGADQTSTSSAAAGQEHPASTELLKRGRGRPRKRPQEPMEEPPPKRPRGRPKGSTNKSPSQAAQKVPYIRRASRQGRRKRGKKRATGQEREQSRQTNCVLMSTQGEGADEPSTSSAAAAQEHPGSTEPLKRGRGRPRKHRQLPVSFEEVAVYFTKEEWDLLDQGHRALYKEVRMKDVGNVASLAGNEYKKENFVETSMVSSETTKIVVEKEELEIKSD